MEDPNLISQLVQTADRLAGSLRPLLDRFFPPHNDESGGFYQVCSVLIDGAVANYSTLRAALPSQNHMACASGCRNLLEIRIFTEYVLQSKENAKCFSEDRLIDGKQLATSLRDLELHLNPELSKSQFEERISAFDEKMQEEGVTRSNYKRTNDMAEAINIAGAYRRMNTLSSKLIHPTSWSLFTANQGNDRFTEACSLSSVRVHYT
jgi:hypothetical protein